MPMPDWFDPSMLFGGGGVPGQPYLPPGLLQPPGGPQMPQMPPPNLGAATPMAGPAQMPQMPPPNMGAGPPAPGMAGPAPPPGGAGLPPGIGMPPRQNMPMPPTSGPGAMPGALPQMPPAMMPQMQNALQAQGMGMGGGQMGPGAMGMSPLLQHLYSQGLAPGQGNLMQLLRGGLGAGRPTGAFGPMGPTGMIY